MGPLAVEEMEGVHREMGASEVESHPLPVEEEMAGEIRGEGGGNLGRGLRGA